MKKKKGNNNYLYLIYTIVLAIVLIIIFSSSSGENTNTGTNKNFFSPNFIIGIKKTTTQTTTRSRTTTELKTKRTTTKTTSRLTTTPTTITTNQSTSINTTTTTSKRSDKLVVIDQGFVYEDNITYKYGVKITVTKKYLVVSYNDGTENKTLISEKTKYDKSTYNGTTTSLLQEAKTLNNKNQSIYNEMLGYVNEYRKEAGVQEINIDNELNLIATIRALELAWSGDPQDISHTRPNGKSWSSIYGDMNYPYSMAGENIAAGQTSASKVSVAWKNSKGHYSNIIHNKFTKVGFGYAEVNGIKYWVQLFAK